MPHAPSLPSCLAVATLLLAGCGAAEPSLGTAVAEELAQRADGVASALADGDGCLALERIGGLRSATATARDAGEVPDTIAAEVLTTTQRIEQDVTCEPTPPPEPDEQEQDEQGGQGTAADDARDHDDDDEDDEDDDGEAGGHPSDRGRGHGRDGAPGRSDD